MLRIVQPTHFGDFKFFSETYETAILGGQFKDSTESQSREMEKKAASLHRMLERFVHRREKTSLASTMVKKKEFILYLRLSPVQTRLYKVVILQISILWFTKLFHIFQGFMNLQGSKKVLTALPTVQKITAHPLALRYKTQNKRELTIYVVSGLNCFPFIKSSFLSNRRSNKRKFGYRLVRHIAIAGSDVRNFGKLH